VNCLYFSVQKVLNKTMKKSSEKKIYRCIGLMSGTAMDGIDAAMIETDGDGFIKPLGFVSIAHNEQLRERLKSQLNKIDFDKNIECDFTLAQLPAINNLLSQTGLTASDIDYIGFHGQTIHHDPDNGITVQMGDGQLLADKTDIDVVYDFRSNDMTHGGQGAPLLPVYHRALVSNGDMNLPIVILNLGGVGNITWISNDDMVAFDTGPANAMIDDWIKSHTGQNFDEDGKIASNGVIDVKTLNEFLALPYFKKPYPKSLDRNDFQNVSIDGLNLEDGAATLTAMTVQSIAKGIDLCPQKPTAIYVTGGGRNNSFIMSEINRITNILTHSVDDLGWDGDAMEAEGFAYMAVRPTLGKPISFPKTTGCAQPAIGGILAKADLS
jgi:anhydro-N-acetylmuramic acid kinase